MGYSVNSYSDELCHYGIKGMKWGVRKNRSTLSSFGRKMANGKFGQAGVKAGRSVRNTYNSVKTNGIGGAMKLHNVNISKKQSSEAMAKRKQLKSVYNDLKQTSKNPKGLAGSKASTAIRNYQMKSINKQINKIDKREATRKNYQIATTNSVKAKNAYRQAKKKENSAFDKEYHTQQNEAAKKAAKTVAATVAVAVLATKGPKMISAGKSAVQNLRNQPINNVIGKGTSRATAAATMPKHVKTGKYKNVSSSAAKAMSQYTSKASKVGSSLDSTTAKYLKQIGL